jgi:arylsulfatase A-like enzyme
VTADDQNLTRVILKRGEAIRLNFLWGALWGMIAWQVYALIEYTALTVVPLWRYSNMKIAGWNWHWSLVLFGFYTVAGLIAGGTAGAVFGGWRSRDPRNSQPQLKSIGSLTLVLAFLANLLTEDLKIAPLLATAIIACTLIWSLLSETWGKRLDLLANPWVIATLLLFAAWNGNAPHGLRAKIIRFAIGMAVMGVFIGASIASVRFKRTLSPRVLRYALTISAALLIVFGCAGLSNLTTLAKANRPQTGAPRKPGPNVVLITMDTVRADHVSLYGYGRHTTPNLEKLAQSSTVFTHAMSASNVTVISHAAMFTGLYGSWNGVGKPNGAPSHGGPLLDKYATLPVILAKEGYFTGAVVANTGNLQAGFGFDRGFQFFDSLTSPQLIRLDNPCFLRNGARRILDRFTATTEFDLSTRRAEEINREAFGFLDQARTTARPFFLFLNYMDAHSAYAPPAPFGDLYPGKDGTARLTRYLQLTNDLAAGKAKLPQRELQHYISQYDGGISYIDFQIGELIHGLENRGLFENTLIVITADHGEALGDRNLLFHGLSVYQNQVHVPLIIKYPGRSVSQVVGTTVGHVDLLPTILDVAGISIPDSLQGWSLKQNVGDARRTIISEGFPRPGFARIPGFNTTQRAIYEGKWKLMETKFGHRELYDVESDQAETHDLCSVHSAECAGIGRALDSWVSKIPLDTTRHEVDPRTLEMLKSLGYAGR